MTTDAARKLPHVECEICGQDEIGFDACTSSDPSSVGVGWIRCRICDALFVWSKDQNRWVGWAGNEKKGHRREEEQDDASVPSRP